MKNGHERVLNLLENGLLPQVHGAYNEALKLAIEAFKTARWIPVDERLPEVMYGSNDECSDDVLICVADDENTTISTGFYGYYPRSKTQQGWWSMWAHGCNKINSRYKVVAWMPLPTPYQPKEGERMTQEEAAVKELESMLEDRFITPFEVSETLDIDVTALKKQQAIKETTPSSDDWEQYADRLYDIAYKNGYDQALKDITEKQPCEDTISRRAVINTLFYASDNNCDVVLSTDLMDRINSLPSVQPLRDMVDKELCKMTIEDYRQRMIQAFNNANADELIAMCVLPMEKEFEHLEWLLKTHYKKEPCEDAISRQAESEDKNDY